MTTIDPAVTLGELVAGERDWRRASLGELCDHIVAVHHERLRRELPQIGEMIGSVMRVHGSVDLELTDLPRAFAKLRDPLEAHRDARQAICRTHRRLLEALHALELDLHRHIHEENNILFPRVRAALAEAHDAS
jgi:iron-sulfur cluster repair protein YtfE (RIC family)